jgi:hypothetical protein
MQEGLVRGSPFRKLARNREAEADRFVCKSL